MFDKKKKVGIEDHIQQVDVAVGSIENLQQMIQQSLDQASTIHATVQEQIDTYTAQRERLVKAEEFCKKLLGK